MGKIRFLDKVLEFKRRGFFCFVFLVLIVCDCVVLWLFGVGGNVNDIKLSC